MNQQHERNYKFETSITQGEDRAGWKEGSKLNDGERKVNGHGNAA